MTAIDSGSAGRFDLGRVMERTFSVIGKNFATFLLAAIILVGIPSVITVMGQGGNPLPQSPAGWVVTVTGWFLSLVGSYLLQATIVYVAVTSLNKRTASLRMALGTAVKRVLPIVGMALLILLATVLATALLIVPGVIVAILWCVAAPALIVEKRSIFSSLQRSRDLTRGFRWPIFGLFVIYIIVSWVITATFTGVSMATGGGLNGSINLIVALIFTPLISIVQGIIGSSGVAAIYYELRTAKEGVGADELAAVFD